MPIRTRTIELDLLERKIKYLVNKLKKHNIHLEVFNHEDIVYGVMLGKGGEGVVQKCIITYNDLPVSAAVKKLLNNTDDSINITLDEIELLCLARDPIIPTTLQVYGVTAVPDKSDPTKGHLEIITEVGIKNALQLYQDELIPAHLTLDIWSRVASALHCMHCKRIMHQDLKPENILITRIMRDSDGAIDKVDLRVIDLGMAQHIDADRVYTDDVLGTTGYHAPEVLFDDSYAMSADIFVLGITFCVMLLPQSSLEKTPLLAFLNRIHEAKEKHLIGRELFESIIEPEIAANLVTLSISIKNMICVMLEHVSRRSVALLEVTQLCGQESARLRDLVQRTHQAGPVHAPLHSSTSTGSTWRDSGIDSASVDVPSTQFRRSMSAQPTEVAEPMTPVRRGTRRRHSVAGGTLMTRVPGVTRRTSQRLESLHMSNPAASGEERRNPLKEKVDEEEEDIEPVGRRTRSTMLLVIPESSGSSDTVVTDTKTIMTNATPVKLTRKRGHSVSKS